MCCYNLSFIVNQWWVGYCSVVFQSGLVIRFASFALAVLRLGYFRHPHPSLGSHYNPDAGVPRISMKAFCTKDDFTDKVEFVIGWFRASLEVLQMGFENFMALAFKHARLSLNMLHYIMRSV